MSELSSETVETAAEQTAEHDNPIHDDDGAASEQPVITQKTLTARDYIQVFKTLLHDWGWVGLLFVTVFLVGYYTLFPSRGYFHSDCTDTLMWAVASEESSSLFNPEFNYACLLPFGTSLIMWALIPIFGVTMTTHVIGMLIFALLFMLTMIWMFREMKWSWNWTSVGTFVVLMICSGSEKLREIFWGHTIYYSLGVLFIFVGLALLFKSFGKFRNLDAAKAPEQKKKEQIWLYVTIALLGIWFVLTCMNQIISIAIFALPVIGALFCERWLDHKTPVKSKATARVLMLLGVMAAGMVVGYLITNVTANGIVAGYEGAFSNYSPMEEWAEHVNGFPRAWFSLLGADMRGGDKLMSVASVGDLLIVITGVILLITPIAALICYKKLNDRKLRILVLTYWLMFMLIMMGYIMGRLSSANWRLSPIVAMSAVVTAAFFKWTADKIEWQRLMSLLMIPVMMVCCITAVTIARMPADNTQDNHLYRLADALEQKNLNYGYATFWNANGLTVVSDSKVECRSVTIDENGLRTYTYQSLNSWFKNQPGQERYFLLMTQGERDLMLGGLYDETKIDAFEVDGYIVWVFNDNLF